MEENLISEGYLPLYETDELPYEIDESKRLGARFLRYLVVVVFISYAVVASVSDILVGFYAIKLFLLGITCLLLFTPVNYPYLLGLIVVMYYELKPYQLATPETTYMFKFTFVIIILMAAVNFFLRAFGNRRNPYQRFDLGSFCLLGLVVFSLGGVVVVGNRFLYARGVVAIIGFGCAYYLGKSFLRNLDDLKMLLKGLFLGLLAFTWPLTIGYVIRHGSYVLATLYKVRTELGVGREAGLLIFAFALTFSISGGGFPPRLKRFAFWLLAAPLALTILLLQQRTSIFLIPVAVALTLMFSGRRLAALWTVILTGIGGLLVLIYAGGLFTGFRERLFTMAAAAEFRMDIYLTGIKLGLANPLFGIGAGQFYLKTWAIHAHNDAINILAEHGVFAFVLYVVFWIYIVYVALRLRAADGVFLRTLAASFLVVMACYFGYVQTTAFYFARGTMLFAFLMGSMTMFYSKYQAERQHLSYV